MRINSLKTAAAAATAAVVVSLCGFLAFAGGATQSRADSSAQTVTVTSAQAPQSANDPWD